MIADIFLSPELYSAAIRLTCPLAFAALGGLICENAGVLNLALEGMMLMGAFYGYLGSYLTGSPWIGLLCAMIAGLFLAILHAYFSVTLQLNQIVTALGLNMFALGVTSTQFRLIFGIEQSQVECAGLIPINWGYLSKIPFLGPVVFNQVVVFYLILIMIPVINYLFYRSSWGLALRSAGEHPKALDVAGVHVYKIRYAAVIISGLLAGLGGGTLVLSGVNNFFDNLTAGRGFIAFSAIVFGKWTPVGTALATFLFGFIDAVQLRLQALSIKVVPYQFFLALPYITTMFALAIIGSARGPSASGIPYSREGH